MRKPEVVGVARHYDTYAKEPGFIGKDRIYREKYFVGYVHQSPSTKHLCVMVFSLDKKWRAVDFQRLDDMMRNKVHLELFSKNCPCHLCNPTDSFVKFPDEIEKCYVCSKDLNSRSSHSKCISEYQDQIYEERYPRCDHCYKSIDGDIQNHYRCLVEMGSKISQADTDRTNLERFNESIEKYMEAIRIQLKALRTDLQRDIKI